MVEDGRENLDGFVEQLVQEFEEQVSHGVDSGRNR
jgi:hypothetical protein